MRLRFLLLLLAAVTVLTVTALAWLYESRAGLQALKRQAAESLSLKSSNVATEIERFRYLPCVLGQDERIQRLLDDKQIWNTGYRQQVSRDDQQLGWLQRPLCFGRRGTNAGVQQLEQRQSFVGERFGFRPYFSVRSQAAKALLRRWRQDRRAGIFLGTPHRNRRGQRRCRRRKSRPVCAGRDLDGSR